MLILLRQALAAASPSAAAPKVATTEVATMEDLTERCDSGDDAACDAAPVEAAATAVPRS